MHCSRCGTEMPAVANFCSHCGRHLRGLDATGAWPARDLDQARAGAAAGEDFPATTALHPSELDETAQLVSPDLETADALDPSDLETAPLLRPDELDTANAVDPDALAPTLVLDSGSLASDHTTDPDLTVVAPARPATPPPNNLRSPILRSPRPTRRERRPPTNRGDGTAGPLAVGQTFGTRYHIIKVLGVGGMGAVYQGWDTELSESVAIKVIRPEAIEDPSAALELEKRFKRELLLARQVTHRNVVRIHDLGEVDGIKYITMTYVDGTDLATWLKGGPLDIPRTLKITRSIVEGLQAAHAAGIVHRDLKPANIMIRGDGEALIMDFGIARSTNAPSDVSATPVLDLPVNLRSSATMYTDATMSGSIVGTVPYMAPEQARGKDVDQRTDIYALGLIVYDMLAGRHRAARSESAIQELKDRMERAPEPIKAVVPSVPEPLNELVSKCIEPEPANRYATTKDLSDALARLDDHGELRPVQRQVGLPMLAAVVTLMIAFTAGIWWYQRQFIPPAAHDPVSVVIADLQNNTGDAAFDRTLEPMMKRALEGAGFVTAYDRSAIRGLGAKPLEQMDEAAAHELAVKQGLGVVLAGSIDSAGAGYRVVLKASQAIAGTQIFSGEARAASKDKVLDVTTRLVGRVRGALGDDTSDSAQQFAMASVSATSLDVVRLYAKTMEAQSANRFDDALQTASQAVQLDPKFGLGYLMQAVASRYMGRAEDNKKFLDQALSHLDGMTERERYQTRGYSYLISGDYAQCVKEFTELIAKYPSDVAGRNQLALCLSNQRQMGRAMDEIRQVVKILPSHPLFRDNLALYSNYAGDFAAAEQEARAVKGPDAFASFALALAQTGQGEIEQARATYQSLAQIGVLGASMAASGLGDLASYQGQYADAGRILRAGATADLAARNTDGAAAKLIATAYAELSRGHSKEALAAADETLRTATSVKLQFLAGRIYIESGAPERATPLAERLAQELFVEPRAYAKQLQGLTALKAGDARQALTLLREANELFSTWLGEFDLGRASLQAGAFTQADSAFDICLNRRRGEALALFVDEEPTSAYLPQVYYYLGLVREGLKSSGAADAFRQYIALRGGSTDDVFLPEARRRTSPQSR